MCDNIYRHCAPKVTVTKEVVESIMSGQMSLATLFTVVWLAAWTFGGCIACRFVRAAAIAATTTNSLI